MGCSNLCARYDWYLIVLNLHLFGSLRQCSETVSVVGKTESCSIFDSTGSTSFNFLLPYKIFNSLPTLPLS